MIIVSSQPSQRILIWTYMKLSYDVLEHPTLVNKDSFLRVSQVICVNFLRSLTKTVDLRCSTKKLFCNIRKAPFFSLGFLPTRSSFTVGMNSVKYNAPFLIYFHFLKTLCCLCRQKFIAGWFRQFSNLFVNKVRSFYQSFLSWILTIYKTAVKGMCPSAQQPKGGAILSTTSTCSSWISKS